MYNIIIGLGIALVMLAITISSFTLLMWLGNERSKHDSKSKT